MKKKAPATTTKRVNKADSATISSVNQIKQNPKFVKMMVFSTNVLGGLTKLPNINHRDNVAYMLKENVERNIIQALQDHVGHEGVLINSITLLNNIIGHEKFREERVAQLLVEQDLLQKVCFVLTQNKTTLSKDILKVIQDLLSNVTVSQQLSVKVSQSGIIEALLDVPLNIKIAPAETKKILTLVLGVLKIPIIQTKIHNVDVIATKAMSLFKTFQKELPLAIIVLKIIESLVQRPDNTLKLKQKKIIKLQEFVDLISFYQGNDICAICARILMKLIQKEELNTALETLSGEQTDHKAIQMVSNIILAESSIFFEKSVISNIHEILKQHQKLLSQPEKISIIEYALVSIFRISTIDATQLTDYQESLNDVFLTLLESGHHNIEYNALNCLRTIGVSQEGNYEHLYQKGILQKVILTMKNNLSKATIQQLGLQLLVATSTDQKAIQIISTQGFVQQIMSIFDRHPRKSDITENGSRLLYVLSNEPTNSRELSKADSVRVLVEQLFICQRVEAIHLLKIMNVILLKEGDAKKNFREANLQLALVSVLTGRGFVLKDGLVQIESSQNEEEAIDRLSSKQVGDLAIQARYIIDKLISEQEIVTYAKELETLFNKLVNYAELRIVDLEVAIYKLANVVLVPSLGVFTLKIDFFQNAAKLANHLLKIRDFPEKSDLLVALLRFVTNMTQIYWEQDARDLYKEKDITKQGFEILLNIATLENDKVVLEVIQTLMQMVSFQHQNMMKHLLSKKYLLDLNEVESETYVKRILERVYLTMKNYSAFDSIQVKCLELLKAYLYFEIFEQQFLQDATLKLIIQKLNEDATSKEFGIVSVGVLYTVAYKSKQTIAQFAKIDLISKVLDFVRTYSQVMEVRSAATPLVMLMSTADIDKIFSKETGQELDLLMQRCKQVREDFSVMQASLALAQLSTYALVDIYFQYMCNQGLQEDIIELIQFCNLDSYNETFSTDSILVSSFQILTKMCKQTGISKANYNMNIQHLIDGKVSELVTQTLAQRIHHARIVFEALAYLDEASLCKDLVYDLVDLIERKDLLKTFITVQRNYRDNNEMIKVVNRICLNVVKKSEQISKKPLLQNFIRNQTQRTKTFVLFDAYSMEPQILQSLTWFWQLSQIEQPLKFMKLEQCIDLCFSVIRFEVSVENIMVIKKKSETTRKSMMQDNFETRRLSRKSTLKKSDKLKSESQTLQYALRLLSNLLRGEELEVVEQTMQNDRIELLLRIINNLQEDEESIENAIQLLKVLMVSESLINRFKALDGLTAVQNLKIITVQNAARELIVQLLDQIGDDEEDDEDESSKDSDESDEEVKEVKPLTQLPTITLTETTPSNRKHHDTTPSNRRTVPDNSKRLSKRMSRFIKIEDLGAVNNSAGTLDDQVIQQLKENIKSQQAEIDRLNQQNIKKDNDNKLQQQKIQELLKENKNYHEEIIDQSRILTEKMLALKKEQEKVTKLEEIVRKLNDFTGGEELQAQQQDLYQQLEYVQVQNNQLELLCEQQMAEIEQLTQVKTEQDQLIKELQKKSNYEKTAMESLLTAEEVGTPEDSQTSEVDRLEQEIEQKDLYIAQLIEETKAAYEKVKFMEDRSKNLKEKLQAIESHSSKYFWDLEIVGDSMTQLAKDKWSFVVRNNDGVADYSQQITVISFECGLLQEFVNTTFNYDHQTEGFFDTMNKTNINHVKALAPSFLISKTKKQQAFLLLAKLINRKNYSKGYSRQVQADTDDLTAQEEFWFQYCLQQPGTIIFVCQDLGLEEIEIVRRLSYLQVMLGHKRFYILTKTTPKTSVARALCGELQMLQGKLSNDESQLGLRALLQFEGDTEMQMFMQNVIKADAIKLRKQFNFVDQIREYMLKSYEQFFVPESEPEFKIEELGNGQEGFNLTLFIGENTKLKINRPTTIITSQSVINMKFEESGEVHLELFAPAGETISDYKIKSEYVPGQGTKIHIKFRLASEDEEAIQKFYFISQVPQWFVKQKTIENLGHKLLLALEQDLEAYQQ